MRKKGEPQKRNKTKQTKSLVNSSWAKELGFRDVSFTLLIYSRLYNYWATTESISSSTVSTHLAELLDLCSLYTDDGASQALVDQQSQLTLKIHTVVMLVLRDDAMNDTTNYIGRKKTLHIGLLRITF